MPRPRTIPDAAIFAALRQLLLTGGEKAVAFSTVAQATGLAAPTLVQRFGSRDEMVRAALNDGWDRLDAALDLAALDSILGSKGIPALLKAVGSALDGAEAALLGVSLRDAALQQRAQAWRARVEAELALRLGGGAKAAETAAMLFALWQGQAVWHGAGGKGYRLKDAVKRLI